MTLKELEKKYNVSVNTTKPNFYINNPDLVHKQPRLGSEFTISESHSSTIEQQPRLPIEIIIYLKNFLKPYYVRYLSLTCKSIRYLLIPQMYKKMKRLRDSTSSFSRLYRLLTTIYKHGIIGDVVVINFFLNRSPFCSMECK